jgi:phosphatidate cytidylyltransferase
MGVSGVMAERLADAKDSNLPTRTLSALIAIPPVLLAVYMGFPYFDLLVAGGAIGLCREWRRMCGHRPWDRGGLIAIATLLVAVAAASFDGALVGLLLLLAGAAGTAAYSLFAAGGKGAELGPAARRRDTVWVAAGVVYIGLPAIGLIWLRADPQLGRVTVFWLFAVVWAADTAAYLFGRAIGGPKLAPSISPGKTWAGFIAGLIGGMTAGAGAALFLESESLWALALASSGLAVVSQAGDLAESSIKRHFGVKDAGRIMPGHGGLFDRVDSLLPAAATAALIGAVGNRSVLTWL